MKADGATATPTSPIPRRGRSAVWCGPGGAARNPDASSSDHLGGSPAACSAQARSSGEDRKPLRSSCVRIGPTASTIPRSRASTTIPSVPLTGKTERMCRPPPGSLIDQHQGTPLERETKSGGLSGIQCSEGRLVDRDGRRRIDDDDPLGGPQLVDAIGIGSLLDELPVDLAGDEDLHVECSRDVEAPDAREVQQRCRVGDDDHVSEASSDLKSSGS
jgi:hypothetical protein